MDPKAEERKRKEEGRLGIIKAKDENAYSNKRRRVSSIDDESIAQENVGQKVIDIKSTSWKSIVASGKERKSGTVAANSTIKDIQPENDFFLSFD